MCLLLPARLMSFIPPTPSNLTGVVRRPFSVSCIVSQKNILCCWSLAMNSPALRLERMDSHGYCKGLNDHAVRLGYEVLEHQLFPCCVNPMNPTAVTVIRKDGVSNDQSDVLACPRYKTVLKEIEGSFFSPEALVVYPVIGGIPCLRIENGVFASKYDDKFGST